jgi:nucleolar protein 15|tara:strand:+ start:896 stop:1594 length:699 start_codon:yes stop_codon:yes gene_type:complete
MSVAPAAGKVVYLGHIPHGFYEEQMREFFAQFGDVTRLRLSRSKKTGRSKGYAFIEFAAKKAATTAAKVMNNYPLFGSTLVANVMKPADLHAELFKGANKDFQRIEWRKMARERHNAPKSEKQDARRVTRLLGKEAKKRKAMAALGIDYDFAGYASLVPDAVPSGNTAAATAAAPPAKKKKTAAAKKKPAAKAKAKAAAKPKKKVAAKKKPAAKKKVAAKAKKATLKRKSKR